MAIVLEFAGDGDYAILDSSVPLLVGETLEVELIWFNTGEVNQMFLDIYGGDGDFLAIDDTGILRFRLNNNLLVSTLAIVDSVQAIISIERTPAQYLLRIGGALAITQNYSGQMQGLISAGRGQTGQGFKGQIVTVKQTGKLNLDADASVHTAGTPILTDLISGNNATGVNMPTAALGQPGSAWQDNGSGGGDSITVQTKDFTFKQQSGGTAGITFDVDWVGTPTAIEYSIDSGAFVTGDAAPAGNSSQILVSLLTGEHSVTFRFSNDIAVIDSVVNIAASNNFVFYGQSNGSGRGLNNQTFSNSGNGDSAHLYGNDNEFKVLADPYDSNANQVDSISSDSNAAGSYAVRFANKFLSENNTPVGFLPTCLGGTPITELGKNSSVRVGGLNLYESMTGRIASVGGITAVIFDQGESDSSGNNNTTLIAYEAALNALVDDIFADFGVKTIIRALQNITAAGFDGNGTTTGQAAIRQAQLNVAASNANAEITAPTTDIDLSGGDGLHFKTDIDLDDIANRVYDAFSGTSSVSTINLTATGLPDGTYSVEYYESTSPLTYVKTENVTFASDLASATIPLAIGTAIYTRIDTPTPLVTGVTCIGVTE